MQRVLKEGKSLPRVNFVHTAPNAIKWVATKLILKLFIDKKCKRVLFAESNKDFVDFLFNVFTLPFGKITGILKEKGMGGCLPSLFKSIEHLSDAYFLPDQHKDFVLNPFVAIPGPKLPLLLPNVHSFKSIKSHRNNLWGFAYVGCRSHRAEESIYYHTRLCDSCTSSATTGRLSGSFESSASSSSKEGCVKGIVTYMVRDDVEVKPMNISLVTLLNELNVQDMGDIEEKVVELGINEVWELSSKAI